VRQSPATLVYLTLPPLLWASNAIVGRFSLGASQQLVSPVAFNTLRWTTTLVILVVIAWVASRRSGSATMEPSPSPVPKAPWWIYPALGFLAVAIYNTLQYLALRTSNAINVTLVASSGPLWMLLLGRMFFGAPGRPWAWAGAGLSLVGVVIVLAGGELGRLAGLHLERGDLFMVGATIAWALYSWLLRRHRPAVSALTLLLLQTAWGVTLSLPFVTAEWLMGDFVVRADWRTAAVVIWVALGPSLLAYWCWDRGIARTGALLPMFFANLTPLFAALMSAALLGEPPRAFHAVAFLLIAGGIVLSTRGMPRIAPR
jgi:drug/metabolite transporter (DMT)-like permease